MRPYFPGGELIIFISTPHIRVEYATPSSQCLQLGLLGYLIRIAPLAFIPHSQNCSSWAPSPQVVYLGLSHLTVPTCYECFRPNIRLPLVAPGLPRLLAPVLPTTYSPRCELLAKAYIKCKHSESPHHAFAYCGGFAPAALRGAGTSISVSLSGLPLSGPLQILGLVVRYTANCLICRRLILRPCV